MFFKRLNARRKVKAARPANVSRRLRLEKLLDRAMLAGDFGAISGTVFTDLQGNGLDALDSLVSGATVTLYRDGGDGAFNFGSPGSDDVQVQQDVTGLDGVYAFDRLSEGTYFVEQLAGGGLIQRASESLVTVIIDAEQAAGDRSSGQQTIDAFDGVRQDVTDPASGAVTPTSSVAAPEALGGERDLRVTRTSGSGQVAVEVNGSEPNVLGFSSSLSGAGTASVQWDGPDGDALTLDPIGLRAGGATGVDLTAANAEGILVEVGSDQTGNTVVLTVYTDAANVSEVTVNIPDLSEVGESTAFFTIPFVDFNVVAGAGADYSNVGAIEAEIAMGTSSDIVLNVIGAIALNTTTLNLPSYIPLTLGDQVFIDGNDNGLFDGTDLGIDGVDVAVWADSNGDGVFDPLVDTQVATTTTAAGGLYSVSGLFPGNYFVQIPQSEFTLGATLRGFQTSQAETTAPDPNNNVNNDDNGNAVVGRGIVTGLVTLVSLGEPTNDGDTNPNTNLSIDFGVVPQIDVAIEKTVFSATPVAGQLATYRVTVTNNGDRLAQNVVVTDTLPAGIDPGNGGLVQVRRDGVDVTGSLSIAGQTVTMPTIASLAIGASTSFDLDVNVPASGVGAFNNVATVTAAGFDVNPGDNTSDVDLNPDRQADLSLTKSVSAPTVFTGETFDYVITVQNTGPSTATAVSVVDVLPAGIEFVSGVITRGLVSDASGVSNDAGTITALVGNLDVAETVTVTLTVTPTSSASGDIENIASVTGAETDLDASNSQDSVSVEVISTVDLAIDKQGPATIVAGQEMTYTFDITNSGPASALEVTVVDTLPAGVTFVSGTGGTFDASIPGQVTIDVGSLPAGGSTTATMVVRVGSTAVGNLVNVAQVSSPQAEPDANALLDNEDSVTTFSEAIVDLVVTKSDGGTTAIPGTNQSYSITVENVGASAATGTVIEETLPAGTTLVSITEGGDDLTGTATIVGQTVTLPIGEVLSGAPPRVFEVVVSIAPTVTEALVNTVSVTSDQQADEVSTENNEASTTTAVAPQASLVISKDLATPGQVNGVPGENLTYVIEVSNTGPSTATNVSVADVLPAGVTFVSATAPAGTAVFAGGTVTIPFGTLSPGSTVNATVTVDIGTTSRDPLVNVVTVNGDQVTGGTLEDTETTPLVPEFDITVEKLITDVTTPVSQTLAFTPQATTSAVVQPGDLVTFQITVRNDSGSPSAATNVTITDNLPAGLTFVSGTGPNGETLSGLSAIPVGTLEPGQSAQLTFVAQVDANVLPGTNLIGEAEVAAAGEPTGAPLPNVAQVQLDVTDNIGSISGTILFDRNTNGILDPVDTGGLAGVTVQLFDATTGVLVETTTSDADGNYSFIELSPGSYRITRMLPTGFTASQNRLGTGGSDGSLSGTDSMLITIGLAAPAQNAVDFDFGLQRVFSKGLFFV